MSGTSDDDAAVGGALQGIPGSSVIGTKRHDVPSGSELAISGSNKKPRSDDHDDDWNWMNSYKMLTTGYLFSTMNRGRLRIQRLLSKVADSDDQQIERLNQLVALFDNLLTSARELGTDEDGNDDPKKLRLVHLAKQVLQEWENIENAIPQPDLGDWFSMAPIDYPHAVPSPWLFEHYWRDSAHKEVLSMRNKYSYLLDQAYRDSYSSYLGDRGIRGSITLSRKKLLNLMASSREDFEFLDVKKCFKRVMIIKDMCTLTDPDALCAARKMYSLNLDKLLRDEVNKIQSATPDKENKERHDFLEGSLQFLASSRDIIAVLKEDDCRKQLAVIKHRLEDTEDFLSAKLSAATTPHPTNWCDVEYMALQYKSFKFTYMVHDVYLKYKTLWSKMSACVEDLKKLEFHMKRAFQTYRMRRGRISLMSSEKEYYDLCSGSLKEDVEACIGIIKLLLEKQGGGKTRWTIRRPYLLIPKPCKFLLRHSLDNDTVAK